MFTLADDTAERDILEFRVPEAFAQHCRGPVFRGFVRLRVLVVVPPVTVNVHMDMPHRFHNNDMGGLRAAGQVQLAAPSAPPDWLRVEVLKTYLRRAFPALTGAGQETLWYGHRPSTPDGLPVIGESQRARDVVFAFGHGHVGLASGPITGKLVADALAERGVPEAFSPRRF